MINLRVSAVFPLAPSMVESTNKILLYFVMIYTYYRQQHNYKRSMPIMSVDLVLLASQLPACVLLYSLWVIFPVVYVQLSIFL